MKITTQINEGHGIHTEESIELEENDSIHLAETLTDYIDSMLSYYDPTNANQAMWDILEKSIQNSDLSSLETFIERMHSRGVLSYKDVERIYSDTYNLIDSFSI
jgi:hypothetical protein